MPDLIGGNETAMDTVVWRFLMEKKIRALPLDPKTLAKDMGIEVYSYREGDAILEALGMTDEAKKRKGLFLECEGKFCILYADGLPRGERNHILLHELGHYLERHNGGCSGPGTEEQRLLLEKEAEEYALEAIPTPVLYKAGLTTVKDIQRVTQLDDEAAEKIATRVAEYNNRGFGPPEREICAFYKDFIREHRRIVRSVFRRPRLDFLNIILLLVLILVLAFAAFGSLYLKKVPPRPAGTVPGSGEPVFYSYGSEEILFTTETSSQLSSDEIDDTVDTDNTNDMEDTVVYWTAAGEVYHLSRNCPHIRDKKDDAVFSGTVKQSGKERACKSCGS